jgi:hypothetical protein
MGFKVMMKYWLNIGKEMFLLAVMLMLFNPGQMATAETAKVVNKIDEQILVGKWQRTDGGYVLELSDIKKDGTLKAEYFNPRPINVAISEWKRDGGDINIFVELRDVNYPGSKYTLRYDPVSGSLKGYYFQAVEKQTFDVEFLKS